MTSIYSMTQLSLVNSSASTESSNLSETTINKLKALGIDVSTISSESEAKKAIAEAEENNEADDKGTEQDSTDEEKLYNDIKNLARRLGISADENTNIEDTLNKISTKLEEIEDNSNNANLNIFQSELESLELRFKNLYSGESSILSAMDLMAENNRAALGI